jgi:hypothetical protein
MMPAVVARLVDRSGGRRQPLEGAQRRRGIAPRGACKLAKQRNIKQY